MHIFVGRYNLTTLSKVSLSNLAELENVTVAGEGSVTLAGAIKADINATDSTGGVTVEGTLANIAAFTGGAGNDTITLSESTKAHDMGAGDDTVELNGSSLGKDGSVDGGDGVDTLVMSATNAEAMTAEAFKAFTNFEVLGLKDGQAATGINLDNFGDINHVAILGGLKIGPSIINNMDSNGILEFKVDANQNITVNVTDAEENTTDVLNVKFSADEGINYADSKLMVNNVETINITADDTDLVAGGTVAQHSLTLVANKATSVKVDGDAHLELKLDSNTAAIKDIDASGNTGGLKVDLGTLKGVDVTGSSAADEITMGIGNTVTGGEGKDIFIAESAGKNPLASNSYSTIMDFKAGDSLQIGGLRGINEKATVVTSEMDFDDMVKAALANSTSGNAAWFVYNGSAYVVLDAVDAVGAAESFTSGDYLVKLNGVVDLSDATVAENALGLPEGA